MNRSMTAFTPEAARALGGPDWLVERRLAAAEQLDGIAWPTDTEEIWRCWRVIKRLRDNMWISACWMAWFPR